MLKSCLLKSTDVSLIEVHSTAFSSAISSSSRASESRSSEGDVSFRSMTISDVSSLPVKALCF